MGAPSSGKSTCLVEAATFFRSIGWHVICLEEAATVVLDVLGVPETAEEAFKLQKAIFRMQLEAEDHAKEVAQRIAETMGAANRILILSDNGIATGEAYSSRTGYDRLLELFGSTRMDIHARYEEAIALGSTANATFGGYQHGIDSNNPARHHTAVEAAALAPKIEGIWRFAGGIHPPGGVDVTAQRIAQKLAWVAPAACEAPPGPVSMAPQLQP